MKLTAADLTVVESTEARERRWRLWQPIKISQGVEAFCALTDEEHKKRVAAEDQRFDSDKSHDLFSKSFDPSRLQTRAQAHAASVAQASRLLFGSARAPQLGNFSVASAFGFFHQSETGG